MPAADEPPSSPPNEHASPEEALAYYKSQYEQLELELTEFQASSKELEDQLEQDVEASEQRERQLKERIEALGFEVEEWKAKYKQAKTEANSAQNTLQKEITTLRDASRNYQLRLRDIEVANDDFERQARNTSSSLEDLESKYSVAIERAVMLEAEIQIGEQEREGLRIETQRLRDELADLKIEADITHDKLRHAETAAERHHTRVPHALSTTIDPPHSPVSETSPTTTTSSPNLQTSPPPKSASTGRTSAPTPPSPPISEPSNQTSSIPATPDKAPKSRLSLVDNNITPRPSNYSKATPRHSRGPSIPVSNARATPARHAALQKSQLGQSQHTLPSSSSLRQIRGLIGQMQRLEQRVHSARSKLPGPVNTPPHASPRSGSALSGTPIPSNVTLRSGKRRTGGSNVSSIRADNGETTPLSTQHVSRLSLGGPQADRNAHGSSRPSSRASTASRSSISHSGFPQRPSSRTSQTGARTPMGHYPTASERRPRSSLGGSYGGHSLSASVNGSSTQQSSTIEEKELGFSTPTSRRNTLTKSEIGTGIPTPSGLPRRQSGGVVTNLSMTPSGRRTSSGLGRREDEGGEMRPPSRLRKLSGVGETY